MRRPPEIPRDYWRAVVGIARREILKARAAGHPAPTQIGWIGIDGGPGLSGITPIAWYIGVDSQTGAPVAYQLCGQPPVLDAGWVDDGGPRPWTR